MKNKSKIPDRPELILKKWEFIEQKYSDAVKDRESDFHKVEEKISKQFIVLSLIFSGFVLSANELGDLYVPYQAIFYDWLIRLHLLIMIIIGVVLVLYFISLRFFYTPQLVQSEDELNKILKKSYVTMLYDFSVSHIKIHEKFNKILKRKTRTAKYGYYLTYGVLALLIPYFMILIQLSITTSIMTFSKNNQDDGRPLTMDEVTPDTLDEPLSIEWVQKGLSEGQLKNRNGKSSDFSVKSL